MRRPQAAPRRCRHGHEIPPGSGYQVGADDDWGWLCHRCQELEALRCQDGRASRRALGMADELRVDGFTVRLVRADGETAVRLAIAPPGRLARAFVLAFDLEQAAWLARQLDDRLGEALAVAEVRERERTGPVLAAGQT